MADLSNDVRLAVDTGKVSLGYREVLRAVNSNSAKAVVVASKGKKDIVEDINHACRIAGIKLIQFNGGSLDFGTVCGKPYSVNTIAVMDPGHSKILDEEY
ncbi:MAG: 50S ribosomal protein L30e [Candidatus Marsarchaeota archaeon]|nr:50S ribosomal protein L30e [Candidatus Marsarchaeota archaeon]MCL5413114.1 50S ribosomal protein L30e [Candidatus Marsarchaeota archaeon]